MSFFLAWNGPLPVAQWEGSKAAQAGGKRLRKRPRNDNTGSEGYIVKRKVLALEGLRARGGIRTHNLRFTKALLCR